MLHTIPAHPSEHHPHPPQHTIPHHRSAAEAVAAAQNDGKLHVLLAASGSVATIKLPLIAERLVRLCPGGDGSLSIRIVLTEAATRFLAGQSPEQPTLSALDRIDGVDGIYLDKDEWGPEPWKREDPILHIELRKWAHIMVIAPLSANTLSEIVSGGCRSLLTSVVRAWDATGQVDGLVQLPDVWVRPISRSSVAAISSPPTSRTFPATYASTTAAPPGGSRRPAIRKRIVVAPAMNTAMWEHPVTAQQIAILERDWGVIPDDRSDDKTDVPVSAALDHTHDPNAGGWFEVLRPQANKRLACGDVGAGAMAKWEDIVRVVLKRLGVWTLATAPK